MDTQIIAALCICDNVLTGLHHHYEDPQCQMSDAEVMTTALTAVMFYGDNYAAACNILQEQGYMPRMLSASRFNRRLHRIAHLIWCVFGALAEYWKTLNTESIYSLDSFPVAACDNIRIRRAKLYQDKAYRGKSASARHPRWTTSRSLPYAGFRSRCQYVG